MLRVTVEFIPGGDETRARTAAIMNIGNITAGPALSDYTWHSACEFEDNKKGVLGKYPRWSESVWGLVGRCALHSATGSTALKKWSKPKPVVPDLVEPDVVDVASLPPYTRNAFCEALYGSGSPAIEGRNCAWLDDWYRFIRGRMNPVRHTVPVLGPIPHPKKRPRA